MDTQDAVLVSFSFNFKFITKDFLYQIYIHSYNSHTIQWYDEVMYTKKNYEAFIRHRVSLLLLCGYGYNLFICQIENVCVFCMVPIVSSKWFEKDDDLTCENIHFPSFNTNGPR